MDLSKKLWIVVAVFISTHVLADLQEDMANPKLTLMDIVDRELDGGKDLTQIVEDMINIEADQSTAIVAAALRHHPDQLDQIVAIAVNGGANSWEIAGAAIMAVGARKKLRSVRAIVDTLVALDVDNSRRIVLTASNVSAFDYNTIAGIEDTQPEPGDRNGRGSGYYASAQDMEEIPGPVAAQIVEPRSTLGKRLSRRNSLTSLRSPR